LEKQRLKQSSERDQERKAHKHKEELECRSEQCKHRVGLVNFFTYYAITFIRGVPIFVVFVARLIHEIKNPMNNETWEAV
jgi:hypothetical protein